MHSLDNMRNKLTLGSFFGIGLGIGIGIGLESTVVFSTPIPTPR